MVDSLTTSLFTVDLTKNRNRLLLVGALIKVFELKTLDNTTSMSTFLFNQILFIITPNAQFTWPLSRLCNRYIYRYTTLNLVIFFIFSSVNMCVILISQSFSLSFILFIVVSYLFLNSKSILFLLYNSIISSGE